MKLFGKRLIKKKTLDNPASPTDETPSETHLMEHTFKKWIIMPDSRFRIIWDCTEAILALYSAIMVPVRVGLDLPSTGVWYVFELLVDLYFIINVVFNFFAAYDTDLAGRITDRKMIAHRYVAQGTQGFLLDFFSAIPIDWIEYWITSRSGMCAFFGVNCNHKPAKGAGMVILRLARMPRVWQMNRIPELFQRYEEPLFKVAKFIPLVKTVGEVVLIAHVIACMFNFLSTPNFWTSDETFKIDTKLKTTWVNIECPDGWYDTEGSFRYLVSLMWSFTVLTSRAAAAIPSSTIAERIFFMISMWIGVGVVSFVIGKVGILMNELNQKARVKNAKLAEVRRFCRDIDVPFEVRAEAVQFFRQQVVNDYDASALLAEMPSSLRITILKHMYSDLIGGLQLFQGASIGFIEEVCTRIVLTRYQKGTVLCRKGEVGKEMFIISKGQVDIVELRPINPVFLGPGNYFGEGAVLGHYTRNATIEVTQPSVMCVIKASDMQEIFAHFPDEKKKLDEQYEKRQNANRNNAKPAPQPPPTTSPSSRPPSRPSSQSNHKPVTVKASPNLSITVTRPETPIKPLDLSPKNGVAQSSLSSLINSSPTIPPVPPPPPPPPNSVPPTKTSPSAKDAWVINHNNSSGLITISPPATTPIMEITSPIRADQISLMEKVLEHRQDMQDKRMEVLQEIRSQQSDMEQMLNRLIYRLDQLESTYNQNSAFPVSPSPRPYRLGNARSGSMSVRGRENSLVMLSARESMLSARDRSNSKRAFSIY